MTRAVAIAIALSLSITAGVLPALAGQEVYTYAIVHPFLGEIGTITDTINRGPEVTRSDWRLRVAVRLLGIVVYRQESDTTEIMRGNRLVWLQSATNKNGVHFQAHGEAQGDKFKINATAGSFTGPATIAPSDPWMLRRTGEETVVYMDTGRIIKVHISGGDYDTVLANGALLSARHFTVMGEKRQEVWLDERNIPAMFRIVENDTPIDFVLQYADGAGATTATPHKALPTASESEKGNR